VIAVDTGGTAFQQRVWKELRKIPAGRTVSYGCIAAAIGAPSAVRAVGAANGANPVGIVLPCHRVVGSNGQLTGYGGGLERKRWLLAHESAQGELPSPRAPLPKDGGGERWHSPSPTGGEGCPTRARTI
jgi:methylated-DNA-[protein]-cysteine S-methyltransferase